jgi:N-hydroxyarylamine O-acetyltransferase
MSDVSQYLSRIRLSASPRVNLCFLQKLVLQHTVSIPFDGLDPFLGRPVSLEPHAIMSKLVHGGRGGYCHEQNSLMHDILVEMGFTVTALRGRVVWMRPSGDAPATHRLTLVEVEGGRFIVDVGFGPNTPTAPLHLRTFTEQPTPTGIYRIADLRNDYRLEIKIGDRWEPLYLFNLEQVTRADLEVANWFMSTHPRTLFVRNLVVSRRRGCDMLSLVNGVFTSRTATGETKSRTISDPDDLGRVLRDELGVQFPLSQEEIWRRLPYAPVPAWP